MKNKIDILVNRIKGDTSVFPEKQRNFNLMVVMAFFTFVIFLIFDLTNTVPMMALVLLVAIGLLALVFYITRVKQKFVLAFNLFQAIAYVFLTLGFLLNEGINGPVIFIFFVSLLVHFASSPSGKTTLFLVWHAVCISSAIIFQYFFPEYIQQAYSTRAFRFIDFLLTAIISLLFFRLVFHSIEKVFLRDQEIIKGKSLKLEAQQIELKSVLNDKEKLLKIVAHDLRSPLASIREYLNLLENKDMDLDMETRHDLEQRLGKLTDGASEMLQDLLEWTKEKSVVTVLKPVELNDVLLTLEKTVRPKAEAKRISLSLHIESLSTKPIADRRMLTIVLRNLLDNAIKFTPQGGTVKVQVETLKNRVVIKVADNGTGMSDRTKGELFKNMTKSKAGTNNETGSGLGLYVCYDLMQQMNGKIEVDSTPRVGTEFRLILKTSTTKQLA